MLLRKFARALLLIWLLGCAPSALLNAAEAGPVSEAPAAKPEALPAAGQSAASKSSDAKAGPGKDEAASAPSDTRKKLPWLERLWRHLEEDYGQRLDVKQWSLIIQHFFDSLLILIVTGLAIGMLRIILKRINRRMERLYGVVQRRKVDTIASLIYSTLKYAVYIASSLWILSRWGVDTQSLVVGSAVIGAAVGFGSQGLVQDVITGLSILAENQLGIGDYVEIAGKTGAVEEIGLRVVKLRDHLGVQHIIFNRNIGVVSNYTAGGIQALADIALANPGDAEEALRVAAQVGDDLARELPYFTRPPEIEGVHQSSTNELFLRLKLHVLPQQDAAVQSQFTERIKRAFAAAKIEIPGGRVRIIVLSELFTQALSRIEGSALTSAPKAQVYDGAV